MGVNRINVNSTDSNYTHSIFDITEYTGKTYATLTDALADVPDGKQKGGMTVAFVSTSDNSDNKYVQYRLMTNTWSTAVANWQGVDNEPIYGSKNLVESGGVSKDIELLTFGDKRKEKYFINVKGIEEYSGRLDVAASPFVTLSGEDINVSRINYSKYGPAVAFYNASRNFISGWNPDDNPPEGNKQTITCPASAIPSGAVYCRVTFADNGEFTSGYTSIIQGLEKEINDIQSDVTDELNSVSRDIELLTFGSNKKVQYFIADGGIERYSGRLDVAASPFVTLNGEDIIVSLINYSKYGPAVAFYDANRVFTHGWNPDSNPPSGRKQAITCPASEIQSNDFYCRVTFADNGEFTSGYTLITQGLEKEIKDNNEEIDDIKDEINRIKETLPDYWLMHLSGKLPLIHANEEDAAMNGDSFFFLTDYHIESNAGYSDDIIKYIQERCIIKNLVFGGDVFNGSTTKDGALDKLREFYHRFYPITYYGLRGNHEFNLNDGGGQAVKLNDNEIFNYLIRKEVDNIVLGGNDKLYYYRDIDRLKLRYIYLDARYENSTDPIDDTQLSWMESRITELQSDWSVIIFSHQLFALVSPGSPVTTNPGYNASGTKIINKLTSINTGAKIVAIITGHSHYDFSTNEHGFLEICTTCDTRQEYGGLPTTLGTPNEQAFDVFSINLVAKTIKATRIGRGANRSWTY